MAELGESVAVTVVSEDPEKDFKAEVIAIKFNDGFTAAHGGKKISGDHWPAPVFMAKYSEKPAVFAFGGSAAQDIDVTIKVESKGYSGNGKLAGLGDLEFTGSCPLASGEHKVKAKLVDTPDSLTWFVGNINWTIDLGASKMMIGSTFLELSFVFADPSRQAFFSKKGVWTEAIRFLFERGRIRHEKKPLKTIKKVTRCCFALKNHKYEIKSGAARFGGATTIFKLTQYMAPTKGRVNCYDQTYAVIVFSGALGLEVGGLFLRPFGFLATTNLVGWGKCNNPFPTTKYQDEVSRSRAAGKTAKDYLYLSDMNDIYRQGFGNHMYCEFSALIYDACAGPVLGRGDRLNYANTAIDSVTDLYKHYTGFRPGTVADMVTIASIGADVKEVK